MVYSSYCVVYDLCEMITQISLCEQDLEGKTENLYL